MKFSTLSFLALLLFSAIGCGVQDVSKISITRVGPEPEPTPQSPFQVFTTDIQGSTSTPPVSASFRLSDHMLTKTTKETESSSASFRMVGGVGLE